MVSQNTKLYAPTNSQIVSAWWLAPTKTIVADGVGGEILLRIKIADLKVKDELKTMIYIKNISSSGRLNWVGHIPKLLFAKNGEYKSIDPKSELQIATKDEYNNYLNSKKGLPYKSIAEIASQYVYVYFIHLSKTTINFLDPTTKQTSYDRKIKDVTTKYNMRMAPNIDIDHPLNVKKGQLIGYVGDATDNGGWPHHVHIETYAFVPSISNRISRVYGRNQKSGYRIKNKVISSVDFRKTYFNSKAVGTYYEKSVSVSKKVFEIDI